MFLDPECATKVKLICKTDTERNAKKSHLGRSAGDVQRAAQPSPLLDDANLGEPCVWRRGRPLRAVRRIRPEDQMCDLVTVAEGTGLCD